MKWVGAAPQTLFEVFKPFGHPLCLSQHPSVMSSQMHPSSSPNFSQRNTGSGGLPPLPHIRDRRLQTQIFTHRSLARRPKRSFEDSPDDPSPDNEQLVHIGDPVFSLVVTDLIRDLFPNLSVGPSSKVRDRLKQTATLARVAVLYRLHDHLLVQAAQANEVKASQNAQAEVFKAYVGGLYREQGMGPVNDWLRSLFQLYVLDAYENIRREHLLPPVQTPYAPTLRSVS
ncbi:ribonuclease III domain-containing protein [Lactarius indigo]|nr:ribonuclease III domain-containing protein [Lactarius indigo]